MSFRSVTVCLLAGAAMLAGCASTPSPAVPVRETPAAEPVMTAPPPAPAPWPEPRVAPSAPPPPSYKKSGAENARADESAAENPRLQPGEYAVTVESDPSGMTVVVNGKPCGKTPCVVVVQANARGFLREQVSIKVRFVAANEAEESQTVEEVLATLDKVPAGIRFTQTGASRIVR